LRDASRLLTTASIRAPVAAPGLMPVAGAVDRRNCFENGIHPCSKIRWVDQKSTAAWEAPGLGAHYTDTVGEESAG